MNRCAAAIVALSSCIACVQGTPALPVDSPLPSTGPNVLIILTDDQRAADLGTMPNTLRWFRRGGTEFRQAFATTPICCPSRASILTGQYAHNHGVRTNADVLQLDETSTLQYRLKQTGYFTGMVGKYLNLWPVTEAPGYFDRYALIPDDYPSIYYNFDANVNGDISRVADQYSTDFMADQALNFLDDFEEAQDRRPWFLYLALYAPHRPVLLEAPYNSAPVTRWGGNPATAEQDRSDKPVFVRERDFPLRAGRSVRREQLRSLKSVDDLVTTIFSKLTEQRETRDTLVFFMSDNGYMLGEHGLASKTWPYTLSIKVPMFARWPGHFAAGAKDDGLVANIDVAPTVFEAANLSAGGDYQVDGRSLLSGRPRTDLLLEHWHFKRGGPDWASLRTDAFQYIEWYFPNGSVRFKEYYDLERDPWQLENLFAKGDLGIIPHARSLHRRLVSARACAGPACP